MAKSAPKLQPETVPLPLASWQRQLYPHLGAVLKLLPLLLLAVLGGMMIWTAIPRGGSTVKIDPDNIFVSDNAHLLNGSTKTAIHEMNTRYKALPKKPQLMVITVDHLPADQTIEQFTIHQATTLGVGAAGEDSGVVYLIAKAEHQARLEVGYGMEAQIPDAMTDVVTDDQVKSDYRRGDYNAGVQLVVQRLDQLIRTGDIQPSHLKTVSAAGGFHPLTAVWTWLNTTHNFFVVLLAGLGFVLGLYWLRRVGWRLQARVWLDDLVQGYVKAMRGINPDLPVPALLTVPAAAEAKTARTTLHNQLRPAGVKAGAQTTVPDYFSMQFAFGETTVAEFYAKARKPSGAFTKTSMFHHHHQDWYRDDRKPLSKRRLWPRRHPQPAAAGPANDVRPYLLTPLMQGGWWLVRLLANGWVLLIGLLGFYWYTNWFMTRGYSPWVYEWHYRLLGWWQTALRLLERLLAENQSVLEGLDSLALALLLGAVILAAYFGLDALCTRAKRHLELNRMIRDFLAALRTRLKRDDSDALLADALADSDPALIQAKTALQTSLGGKARGKKAKGVLPDYYDMAFAFGSVSVAQFFAADAANKDYKTSSMYVNHESDWYSSGSGSGDGGGDSFGGGGFGGGGGTSSW